MVDVLKTEQDRYEEFIDELKNITDEKEQRQRALLEAQDLTEQYKPKGLTLSSLRSLWSSELQADTPEEEEVFVVVSRIRRKI